MKETLKEIMVKDLFWGEYDKWYVAQGGEDNRGAKAVEMFLCYLFGDTQYVEKSQKYLTKGFEQYLQPSQHNNLKLVFPESPAMKSFKKMLR